MKLLTNYTKTFFKYRRKLFYSFEREYASDIAGALGTNHSKNANKLNLLFFGSDQFSVPSLSLLHEKRQHSSRIGNVDVVTTIKGKPNPVKRFTERNSLRCFDWPVRADVIKNAKYDLGIVVSFGHLIPEDVINAFPLGMINIHGSLLPRWRGASPIIYTILNEDSVAGVSLMRIQPKHFDVGEILAQRKINVPENVLMSELHANLSTLGAELLNECVENMPDSLNNARPQGTENITYASKVDDSIAIVNWEKMSARHIFNLYRALYSFKVLLTSWRNHRVKIQEIIFPDERDQLSEIVPKPPGHVEYLRKRKLLRVFCANGDFIFVNKLGIHGKRIMSAPEFSNGFLNKVSESERFFR